MSKRKRRVATWVNWTSKGIRQVGDRAAIARNNANLQNDRQNYLASRPGTTAGTLGKTGNSSAFRRAIAGGPGPPHKSSSLTPEGEGGPRLDCRLLRAMELGVTRVNSAPASTICAL
jgi:hypothetical protein